jgi:uncharacterized membrane protein
MWVQKMKFRDAKPFNPFDNPFIAAAVHIVAMLIVVVSIYFTLEHTSMWPLAFGFAFVSVMEAAWLYFKFRK